VGWQKVLRDGDRFFLPHKGMGVDIGGIGKEYAVDRVTEMAAECGINDIMVDFGHDIRVHGEPPEGGPWRIGLEDPTDPTTCWGGVMATDRAAASSGDYHRGLWADGKRYGHILDSRTGYPVSNGCRSVSVIARTCTETGILSTAAFILGPEEGLSFLNTCYQAERCIWTDRSQLQTAGFSYYVIPKNSF